MDTPSNNPKSWSALVARAREHPLPEIDVRHAVRSAIAESRRHPLIPAGHGSLLDQLAYLAGRRWVSAAVAAMALVAGGLGYAGMHAAAEISFVIGFGGAF